MMNKESWILTVLIIILITVVSVVGYFFFTTDLIFQMKQMLQDTLKTTETNQFESAKVYPYLLLLAITGLIYGLVVAAWHSWKRFQQQSSQCTACQRQRQPTFTHIHYICHCDKSGIGYCYPFFQKGWSLQPSSQNTQVTVTFLHKKPLSSVPNEDHLMAN